jgi:hypothetical protein
MSLSACVSCGEQFDAGPREACDQCNYGWKIAALENDNSVLRQRLREASAELVKTKEYLGKVLAEAKARPLKKGVERRPVRSSNSSLRFYEMDGWSALSLDQALGEVELIYFADQVNANGYWAMMPGPRPGDIVERILKHGDIYDRNGTLLEGGAARRHVDDHLI